MVAWTGWPLISSSWEPLDHLTPALIRSYENPPKPEQCRIEQASRNFFHCITKALKGRSPNISADAQIDLDIQRWFWKGKGVLSLHRGCKLYERKDFCNLSLPETWWYFLDKNGEGRAIDFPIKI